MVQTAAESFLDADQNGVRVSGGENLDFLNGEVRYNALARQNPEKAARLFKKNEQEAMERYEYLKKLVTLYGAEE